jgi:hypothetical protein
MKHLPDISMEVIPHRYQAYDTCGDYISNELGWTIKVSKLKDWKMEFLVAIHELIEFGLITNDGVSLRSVNFFDKKGKGKYLDEPGLSEEAPYHKQHMIATQIEEVLAKELGVDWEEYDKEIKELKWKTNKLSKKNVY